MTMTLLLFSSQTFSFLSYCIGYSILAILNQTSLVDLKVGIKIFSEQRLSGDLSSRKCLGKQFSKSFCL